MAEHDRNTPRDQQPQPEEQPSSAICGPDTYSPLIIGGADRPLPLAESPTPSTEEN